jgi:hypothetical protein
MVIEWFQDYIPMFVHGAVRVLVVFIATTGIVYMVGRGLELLNSNRSRNFVAIITSFGLSYWSVLIYDTGFMQPNEIYWRTLLYASGTYILFVLVTWKLYDRWDNFLDKRFAPDEKKK